MLAGPSRQHLVPMPDAPRSSHHAGHLNYPAPVMPEGGNISPVPHLAVPASFYVHRPAPEPIMPPAAASAPTPPVYEPRIQDAPRTSPATAHIELPTQLAAAAATTQSMPDTTVANGGVCVAQTSTRTSTTALVPIVTSPHPKVESGVRSPPLEDVAAFHQAILPQSSTPPLPDFDALPKRPPPPPPPPAAFAPAYLPEELWPDYIRIWWEGRFAGVWDGFDSFPEHW